jgi:hypothetical protein
MNALNPYPPVILFQKRIESCDTSLTVYENHIIYLTDLDNSLAAKNTYWSTIINKYQKELEFLSSNIRTELSEDKFEFDNFFPTVLPKRTIDPLGNGFAIGRTFLGAFSGTNSNYEVYYANEVKDYINNTFNIVGSAVNRSTGQLCTEGTGGNPDTLTTYSTIHNNLETLKQKVDEYRSFLITLKDTTTIDDPRPNEGPACNLEGQVARDRIDVMIAAIDTWKNYPDFVSQASQACDTFNNINTNNLPASKGNPRELTVLITAIDLKLSYRTGRINQITGYIGGVTLASMSHPLGTPMNYQATSLTGLYGQRYPVIVARMHKSIGTKTLLMNVRISLTNQLNTKNAYNHSINALTQR